VFEKLDLGSLEPIILSNVILKFKDKNFRKSFVAKFEHIQLKPVGYQLVITVFLTPVLEP